MTLKRPWLDVALAATVFTASTHGQRSAADSPAIDVIHYDARIEPDIAGRSIHGVVASRFAARRAPQLALEFDSGDLTIDAVREGGAPRHFSQREGRVHIQLVRAARLDEVREIEVEYQGMPRSGLLFFPDRSQVVFPKWERPTAADRTIVYQKGAYVLHRLRETLGDDAFWTGIRHYTRTYFGKSVTSRDFQTAMEASSRRSLSAFFAEWVY